MFLLFVVPIIPAILLGLLNHWYWKRQGKSNGQQLVLGILLFYGISFAVIKFFIVGN